MHVPKCAGSSLGKSIGTALKAKSVLRGFDRSLFGGFEDFQSFSSRMKRRAYLEKLPLRKFDLVYGHFYYSNLKRRFPQARFITVFREPRLRLLSHFFYYRSISATPIAQKFGSFAKLISIAEGSLHDFLWASEIACFSDNVFARMLLGPEPRIPIEGFIEARFHDQLFNDAMNKLAEFDFVGLLEEHDFEEKVGRWLGREFSLERRNETEVDLGRVFDFRSQVDSHALERIETLSAIDLKIWKALADKLNSKSSTALADEVFSNYLSRQVARWSELESEMR